MPTDDLGNYALSVVQRICDNFGPRVSCSDAERETAHWLKNELDTFCSSTSVEPFEVTPGIYPRGIVRVAGFLIAVCIPFFFLALPWTIMAILLPLAGLITFWAGLFKRRTWFKWAYKKGTSHNAFGHVLPTGSAKSPSSLKRVLIGGHIDSAYEMRMADNKYFLPLTFAGIGLAFFTLILAIIKAIVLLSDPLGTSIFVSLDGAWNITWIDVIQIVCVAILGPCFAMVMRGYAFGNATLGANDNLAGVGVACAVGKYFAKHPLYHVELIVGGFGSEEIGDQGAEAYTRAHGPSGDLANTIIIVPESCGAGKELGIVDQEKMHNVIHSRPTCELLMKAYEGYMANAPHPIPCTIKTLGFAGTDAGPFSLAGHTATAIVGIAGAMNKPSNWHSRHDTPQNLSVEFLGAVVEIIRHFVAIIEESEKQRK